MSHSSPKKSKSKWKFSRKRGGDGLETATDIAVAQQHVEHKGSTVSGNKKSTSMGNKDGRDAASSGINTLTDNAPMHMFGDNVAISGGQFTQAETVIHNVNNTRAEAFKLLQQRVAPSAFHNSAQRIDPPRCHPDTRVAILQTIHEWIVQSDHRNEWLLWLNGAAGAGKSAIIQSIAERCVQTALAIASFFFFRADPRRNTTAPLMATLAYQLIQAIPDTSNDILLTIERNPLIFDQSLELQLQLLLIQPLLRLPKHLQQLFVVFIDGLDECTERNHQSSLIKLLGTVSRGGNHRIIFLVASRREPQIEGAFAATQFSNLLRTIPLDNSDIEQTSEDIQHFLTDRFKDIKETHIRRRLLPSNWPAMMAIEEIVTTSSGQFIYASVVIGYVSSSRGNPAHLLDIVRGIRLRDPSSQNPFAHLDALYQHIFSQVEALDKVLDILAFIFITGASYIPNIEAAFLLEAGGLEVYFADLIAVIECDHDSIKFLHASLPDFLRDISRSERYHINVKDCLPKLLYMFLDRTPPVLPLLSEAHGSDIVSWQQYYRLWAIRELLAKGAEASDRLQSSCMTFSVEFYAGNFRNGIFVGFMIGILGHLKKLNFNDQGQAYHHVLDLFAARIAKDWSLFNREEKAKVKKTPDLLACIGQIQAEILQEDTANPKTGKNSGSANPSIQNLIEL